MKDYIELLHLKHWIKNGFVIAPVIFSFQFLTIDSIIKTLFAFLNFCFSSSFIYIINCVRDKEKDKNHPIKKKRPIADGRISVKRAAIIAAFLLVPVFIFNLLCNVSVLVIILSYMLMNLLYSFKLKDIPILDVVIIAIGFLFRILAGSYAIGVISSDWILITTFFLALFMGFSKRRNEYLILEELKTKHRPVFQFYNLDILNAFVIITAGLSIISYALYAIDPETSERFGQQKMVYSIPLVLLGIFRYLTITFAHKNKEDPVEIVLKDRTLIIITSLWICLIVFFILIK